MISAREKAAEISSSGSRKGKALHLSAQLKSSQSEPASSSSNEQAVTDRKLLMVSITGELPLLNEIDLLKLRILQLDMLADKLVSARL